MSLGPADVKRWAAELEFLACGITDLAPNAYAAELDTWLAAGHGGTMRYIHRQAKKRKDPALLDREAKSVIVLLENYYRRDARGDNARAKVARYARGRDYHATMLARVEQLAARLRENGAAHTRCYVDTGPVAERELARRAGLGWIGKNAMLLRPGVGSWFFIGEIFTDVVLTPDAPMVTDHCGSCTRCLDACPTSAFVEPRVLDATRCISYLTIEQRGPIPDELAQQLDGRVFGCDICNDVCPWNQRFASDTRIAAYQPEPLLQDARPDRFEQMSEAEFDAEFGATPLSRPGLAGMRRNFAAAFPPTRATRDA
ncbi:MAG TPA: tRNA epoxyqueuosine(34) reductase QueG [Gemmatimonadales bacterium]|nr:tRNA epoxyqueuosine(34) reductase QueG [Gemmatimonadales bacterium]